jgi:hypothetical protein
VVARRIASDRGSLDVARFFVSHPAVVGLARLIFPDRGAKVAGSPRRCGVAPDHRPAPEYGDRVGVIAPVAAIRSCGRISAIR